MPGPVHTAINPAVDALGILQPIPDTTFDDRYPELYNPDVQATVEERLSQIIFELNRASRFVRSIKPAQIETLIGGIADDINGFRVSRGADSPATETAKFGDIWLQPNEEGTYTTRVFNGAGFVENLYAVDAILLPIKARLDALESDQAVAFGEVVDALRAELRGDASADMDTFEEVEAAIDALAASLTAGLAEIPATNITGVLDPARIPPSVRAMPQVSSGGVADLTTEQQNNIGEGSPVLLADGRVLYYKGTGSKTSEASYIIGADQTPAVEQIPALPISKTTGLQDALDAKQAGLTGTDGQYLGYDGAGAPVNKPLRSALAGNLLRTVSSGALELLASDLPGAGGSLRSFANRAAATDELPGNLNTGNIVVVGGGDGGFFEVKLGDYSSQLAADPAQGLVFPVGLSDGSQGVYDRIWEQEQGLSADWFKIVPGTVDVTKWNQMIARLAGLQTRTVRLRAGTYVFPSKPTFAEVVDLWGAGLSMTYLERGYSESGGNEVGFFDFTAELSRNSRLNHLTLRPSTGTTGGCMVKKGTPTDVINSWCRWEHVLITPFTGSYAVGAVVDGRDNDVSGGQGHRDWVTDNCFIFPGTTGQAIRFYNATNGHHSGLWAGGDVVIDGGGTVLQNTQDFALSGLRSLGTVILRNCDRVFVSGVFQRVEIEATATRSQVVGTDRGGGVSNLAPASCQVITQNGSYGNFIYEGTHDFKSPPIFRDGFTIEKAASPHPTVPVNYRGDAVQGGSIAGFQFNARDNKSPTPDFLTYAAFRAVSRDITDGTEDGGFAIDLRVNGSLITAWNFDSGIWYQTATGDNRGAGTINCLDLYRNGTKVVGARETGFGAMTGTALKTTFATYTAPTASGTYVAAELQAAMDALQSNSRRLKAIEDALITHGLIGA